MIKNTNRVSYLFDVHSTRAPFSPTNTTEIFLEIHRTILALSHMCRCGAQNMTVPSKSDRVCTCSFPPYPSASAQTQGRARRRYSLFSLSPIYASGPAWNMESAARFDSSHPSMLPFVSFHGNVNNVAKTDNLCLPYLMYASKSAGNMTYAATLV